MTIESSFCPWRWLLFCLQCQVHGSTQVPGEGDSRLRYAMLLLAPGFRLCEAGTAWFCDGMVWHTRLSNSRNASWTLLQSKCPQIKEQLLATSHPSAWVLLSQGDTGFSPPRDRWLVSQFLQNFWGLKLVQKLQRENLLNTNLLNIYNCLQLIKNKYTSLMGKKSLHKIKIIH